MRLALEQLETLSGMTDQMQDALNKSKRHFSERVKSADHAFLKKFMRAWVKWHFLKIQHKTEEARKVRHAINKLKNR